MVHRLLKLVTTWGCVIVLLAGCQAEEKQDDPLSEEEKESAEVRPEVIFAVADDQPIHQYVETQGVVQANRSVTLKPKISGYVKRSHIIEGRRVQPGDTLLMFDRRELKLAVRQARSKYQQAMSNYRTEMTLRNGNGMSDGSNGSSQSKDLVRITTGLAEAEVNLEQARLDLSHTVMKAPFSGVLSTQEQISSGAYLSAGTEVGKLVDDRTVRIRFDVLESELSKIERGMDVQVIAPGGEQLMGEVTAVVPVIDTKTKTGSVIVEADNKDRILVPGMTVNGRIQIMKEDGKARVPRSAVLSRDDGRTLLFKLHPDDNHVQWVYVEPSAQNSEWSIINHKEVNPGDTIAVDRHFALSHKQIVDPRMEINQQ
jgi:RND family efflux transporter MFP subunit